MQLKTPVIFVNHFRFRHDFFSLYNKTEIRTYRQGYVMHNPMLDS